jgi:hypothetical protein
LLLGIEVEDGLLMDLILNVNIVLLLLERLQGTCCT